PGDRVLLMLTEQSDFIDAFFGAIWADAIPVPLFPPIFARKPEDFISTFGEIAINSGARFIVVPDNDVALLAEFTVYLGDEFCIIPASAWSATSERLADEPQRQTNDIALLQYTSGSTGAPKGVALSHSNVLANVKAIGQAIDYSAEDIGVSWLPLYHDMGLIGMLTTQYWQSSMVVMSPLDFARDPSIWLRAISEHRGTLSPAPNFAYRRCLQLSKDHLDALDLSSWRLALCGAEHVDPGTVTDFSARFAPYGFRSTSFYPVYGLAEHTLAVSFPPLGAEPVFDYVDRDSLATVGVATPTTEDSDAAQSFVSVGAPLEGVTMNIRDSDGNPLPECHVGELVVKSPSVMREYFQDAAETAKVLDDGWLKTGDLGYLKDGMLFITGRIKDMIIRNGRKYFPHDIELAAAGVDGVRAGRVTAFSLLADAGKEHLVVLAETDGAVGNQDTDLNRLIGTAVARTIGFRPDEVALCALGALPVTSSGKVRRRLARDRFCSGELAVN
ncbi:MAG: fatty acyl-AMP ligase, partial [Woeseiaceae bacterium]